jgi:hypothetical protein
MATSSLAGLGVDVRVVVDVVTEVIGEELVLDEEMLRLILVHVVVTESVAVVEVPLAGSWSGANFSITLVNEEVLCIG